MTTNNKPYRKAFIAIQTGHDFAPLLPICEELIFCTHGYEPENKVEATVRDRMRDFEPSQDIIVPVGNVVASCILGAIASEYPHPIKMAIYRDREYHIQTLFSSRGAH